MIKTPFMFRPEDEGKKIYKIKQTYEMIVEQHVKANNEEEAFNIFLNEGGIKFDDFNRFLTEETFDKCETSYVDIDTSDVNVKYVGTVCREDENDPYDLVCEDRQENIKIRYEDNVVPFNKTFGRHS